MRLILAIDPGNKQSAYCLYDADTKEIKDCAKVENEKLLAKLDLQEFPQDHEFVVEYITSYGMAVGQSIFDTCVWTGMFIHASKRPCCRLPRQEIKMHLCNSTRAKDKNVNKVLLDRFGYWVHGKTGKGTKEHPGPLYGFHSDMFAALAVAVTYAETRAKPKEHRND